MGAFFKQAKDIVVAALEGVKMARHYGNVRSKEELHQRTHEWRMITGVACCGGGCK